MIDSRRELRPAARALLDEERTIPALTPEVRARAVARARTALEVTHAVQVLPAPRRRVVPAVSAAGLALAFVATSVVAAVTTYKRHAPFARDVGPVAVAAPAASAGNTAVSRGTDGPELVAPAVEREVDSVRPRVFPPPRLRSPSVDRLRAELRLLRPARAFIARGDLAAALLPIGEHTHLFKRGLLAEEREALRVRALWGLGRADEARLAATSFFIRFPRSVLLPMVDQISTQWR